MGSQHPWEIEIAEVGVPYAPTVVINLVSTGYNFGPIRLLGDMLLANPLVRIGNVGKEGHIRIMQDVMGGHKVTFDSHWSRVGTPHQIDQTPFGITTIFYRVITPALIDYWFQDVVGPVSWTGGPIPKLFQDITSSDWEKNISVVAPSVKLFSYVSSVLPQQNDTVSILNATSSAVARFALPYWDKYGCRVTASASNLRDSVTKDVLPIAPVTITARNIVARTSPVITGVAAVTGIFDPEWTVLKTPTHGVAVTAASANLGFFSNEDDGSSGYVVPFGAIAQTSTWPPETYILETTPLHAFVTTQINSTKFAVVGGMTGTSASAGASAPTARPGGKALQTLATAGAGVFSKDETRSVTGVSASAIVNSSAAFSTNATGVSATTVVNPVTTSKTTGTSTDIGSHPLGSSPVAG